MQNNEFQHFERKPFVALIRVFAHATLIGRSYSIMLIIDTGM